MQLPPARGDCLRLCITADDCDLSCRDPIPGEGECVTRTLGELSPEERERACFAPDTPPYCAKCCSRVHWGPCPLYD
jgi:hypothetical protein